ncbi:MAG TPA: molybdopterin-dependent oxidoreductase [Methylomusa anaerophila]|uniref:Dimethyl sulfoxide reductase DmsA n=1 Tax=Methylomusa anaerophila TaxID=1930071 RepID=A0A348AET8_9FIRM|nr:molybdopterin-dependent oxidoreductase [Methylomusa anaerophila]BBB89586.1 dimethyl sulfoxide reductase DmsA precursor [Methylomusa anaerophila]HML89640.1 molybdopterin-dependent oxidoreductase [Methylomusa anaerophila]
MNLLEKAKYYPISRRTFLEMTGTAVAGTVAVMTFPVCGLFRAEAAFANGINQEGRWVNAACWHNCGGRCVLKAYVIDGVVVRQKTDDTHPDSPDFPQQRACWRGRAQRQQVLGADRLKYPMKRKHWQPGGGNKELRGRDEWVRISWDEALDLVADELKRIKAAYGNQAILGQVRQGMERTLSLFGGYTTSWGSTSWGTWVDVGPAVMGPYGDAYSSTGNDRLRLRQSKLIIMWGANPAWSSGGNPAYNFLQARKAGAKFIFIDPFYTDTARVLADEWIPIRPATDAALLLGMAYVMITEDSPARPLIDWEFLNKCTVGFDAGHMPAGADPKENFKDYVLGIEDGQPKTPAWAAEICGVAPEKIRRLAIEYATTKPASVICGGASTRTHRAEQTAQAFITLACMTGNIGVPGAGTGLSCHNRAGNAGPGLVKAGDPGVPAIKNPLTSSINQNELWDAVLTGKYTAGKNDRRDIDIRCVYYDAVATLNQKMGAAKGIEAHREKLEFVVTQAFNLNTQAKFSDIVLPITTQWEKYGGFIGYGTSFSSNREILLWFSQVVDPVFEAKDDIWVAVEIGKRLGLDAKQIDPVPLKQQVFNQAAGAMVIADNGQDYEKLVTITEEDIEELGVTGKPQTGRIAFREFREKGIYQVQRAPGDHFGFTELEDYRNNPEKYPRATPSKKIEIHSQKLADKITSYGWTVKAPIAKYEKPEEGYEDTFQDWNNKVKGEYPLQLYTIHYPRRTHSLFDNVPWLREAFPQEFIMNTSDARSLGLKQGDIVKIASRHGVVVRPLYLTERMMPGVVTLGQGAWIELDEENSVDKSGNVNILEGGIPTGQGHMGANSCNVKVEKYDQELLPDVEWPQRIVL